MPMSVGRSSLAAHDQAAVGRLAARPAMAVERLKKTPAGEAVGRHGGNSESDDYRGGDGNALRRF